jgi:phosphoglycolate phosphatase
VTVVLFWDVDGTLLTTARAGVYSLEEALAEVTGVTVDLQRMDTSGLTDAGIGARALEAAGVEPTDQLVGAFLAAHERRLPASLHRRRGHVLPNVVAILDDLASRPAVRSLLLTGNTERGAATKLSHYGLDRYFAHGGAFCTGLGAREEIARRARALVDDGPAFVIGDTPHDVRCGRAIGASTIAVATGSYDAPALAAAGASHVFEQLPEPARFRRLIGID